MMATRFWKCTLITLYVLICIWPLHHMVRIEEGIRKGGGKVRKGEKRVREC